MQAQAAESAVASLWRDLFPLCGRAVARRAEEVLAPLSGRILGWRIPRVETLGFYEGPVVKAHRKKRFVLKSAQFGRQSDNNAPLTGFGA